MRTRFLCVVFTLNLLFWICTVASWIVCTQIFKTESGLEKPRNHVIRITAGWRNRKRNIRKPPKNTLQTRQKGPKRYECGRQRQTWSFQTYRFSFATRECDIETIYVHHLKMMKRATPIVLLIWNLRDLICLFFKFEFFHHKSVSCKLTWRKKRNILFVLRASF